jgi:hypothetical protein
MQPTSNLPRDASVLAELAAYVKTIDPLTSSGPATAARIVRRTPTSIELQTARHFYAKALLQIRQDQWLSMARVVSCTPAGNQFHVTLEIVEQFPDSVP